jgi:hypothetical protein
VGKSSSRTKASGETGKGKKGDEERRRGEKDSIRRAAGVSRLVGKRGERETTKYTKHTK